MDSITNGKRLELGHDFCHTLQRVGFCHSGFAHAHHDRTCTHFSESCTFSIAFTHTFSKLKILSDTQFLKVKPYDLPILPMAHYSFSQLVPSLIKDFIASTHFSESCILSVSFLLTHTFSKLKILSGTQFLKVKPYDLPSYTNYGQLFPLLARPLFNQGFYCFNLLLLTIERKHFAYIILSILANYDHDDAVNCK